MNAKEPDRANRGSITGTAARGAPDAWRLSDPRVPPPGAWVSGAIGFDSQSPIVLTTREPVDEQFRYEKVSVDELKATQRQDEKSAAPAIPRRIRLRSPPEPLQVSARAWMDQLPPRIRPLELARLFPRIVNRLCALWTDTRLREEYLTGLLMDTRDGQREGFPVAVAGEIAELLGSLNRSSVESSNNDVEAAGR